MIISGSYLEMAGPEASATLTIDLDALGRNYRKLSEMAAPAVCAAAVKADAYGVGLEQAVRKFAQSGCRDFFVAQLSEGLEARALDEEARIYVLNGLAPGCAAQYRAYGLFPVLGSLEEIGEWAHFGAGEGGPLPAALHVDTGMNRLGLTASELDALLADRALLSAVEWRLVMSHLAHADTPGDPHNEQQADLFERLRARLPAMPASLANSGGLLSGPRYHFDMVRPGIALYGGNPFAGRECAMEVVVRLEAPVIQVRETDTGGRVGYGGIWQARRRSRIAVLQVGYGDGFFRILGRATGQTGARVFLGDAFAPVVGRVSMDMITVDVTHIPPEKVTRGTRAEIFGSNISVDEAADWAGTIGYEVLTSLGGRYRRIYVSGQKETGGRVS